MTKEKVVFTNGTEQVIRLNSALYVEGIGYQYLLTLDYTEGYYYVSGDIRKETHEFIQGKYGLPHIV